MGPTDGFIFELPVLWTDSNIFLGIQTIWISHYKTLWKISFDWKCKDAICTSCTCFTFKIVRVDSNRNQSPLLQLDLMDPALLFVEVLVVAMLGRMTVERMKVGRMKVERMKVEMKRHLELQCFVLFWACDTVGFQET